MPRERTLLALSHQETDRVPVDFLATPATWAAVKKHLGVDTREEVLCRLGVDLRHPRQPYVGPPLRRYADGMWLDVWGIGRKPTVYAGGVYQEVCHHPLAEVSEPNQLGQYSWPQPEWWDAAALKAQVEAMDAQQSYAIALPEFGDPGGIFEIAWYMRGMERFFLDMAEQPDMAHGILRRVFEFFIGLLDGAMAALGNRIDLIWTSDDIAHQRGRLISEKTWRAFVAPYHERLNRRVHELGARVMYHSCGAVRPFIPGLIDAGVDVLDVLQFSAAGMDPVEIKQRFGSSLCFHGGMDVQTTLPLSTAEEIRRVARERIHVLGRGGGYILSPGHNIQADTPVENIVAMYSEAGSLAALRVGSV
jgi:uroporphyrinogen decarboxylase